MNAARNVIGRNRDPRGLVLSVARRTGIAAEAVAVTDLPVRAMDDELALVSDCDPPARILGRTLSAVIREGGARPLLLHSPLISLRNYVNILSGHGDVSLPKRVF